MLPTSRSTIVAQPTVADLGFARWLGRRPSHDPAEPTSLGTNRSRAYETGRQVTDDFKQNMTTLFDDILPKWNHRGISE